MIKVVGGDYPGYRLSIEGKGFRLRKGSSVIIVAKDDILEMGVMDSQSSVSGTKMMARSVLYQSVGLDGLWGGLSTKGKTELLVGIRLASGKSILAKMDSKEYQSLLKRVYH